MITMMIMIIMMMMMMIIMMKKFIIVVKFLFATSIRNIILSSSLALFSVARFYDWSPLSAVL